MSFKSRIARFLYGRYGADPLYNALFLIQLIFLFLGTLLGVLGNFYTVFAVISTCLYILSLVLFIWTVFRCLSRNIAARRKENQAYLRLKAKLKRLFRKNKHCRPADTDTHIFRTCPQCNVNLRLPREAGKHTVKCPRCQNRFTVKVK